MWSIQCLLGSTSLSCSLFFPFYWVSAYWVLCGDCRALQVGVDSILAFDFLLGLVGALWASRCVLPLLGFLLILGVVDCSRIQCLVLIAVTVDNLGSEHWEF